MQRDISSCDDLEENLQEAQKNVGVKSANELICRDGGRGAPEFNKSSQELREEIHSKPLQIMILSAIQVTSFGVSHLGGQDVSNLNQAGIRLAFGILGFDLFRFP